MLEVVSSLDITVHVHEKAKLWNVLQWKSTTQD